MPEYYKDKQRENMNYYEQIREITKNIPESIVNFSLPRDRTNPPTQASSNFITNKEQGDWAEDLIFRSINETSKNYVAVRYGKSDDLIAGDNGFDKFYNDFQDELDTIGKRPDLLIFKKIDFDKSLGFNISNIEHSKITEYVKKAVAGLEIRSSAFLIQKYEKKMNVRTEYYLKIVFEIKNKILTEYKALLEQKGKKYIDLLESITEDNIQIISFRRPSWNATDELATLTSLFKELKEAINIIQISKDIKNQNKTTIKINTKKLLK